MLLSLKFDQTQYCCSQSFRLVTTKFDQIQPCCSQTFKLLTKKKNKKYELNIVIQMYSAFFYKTELDSTLFFAKFDVFC